jgi:hypothetical protein
MQKYPEQFYRWVADEYALDLDELFEEFSKEECTECDHAFSDHLLFGQCPTSKVTYFRAKEI